MTKVFTNSKALPIVSYDWGDIGMRLEPKESGCNSMVVMDVTLEPGGMHNFHKHVDQDEIIIVLSGKVVQWVNTEHTVLSAGDSAYVARNTVHGSFNEFNEPAKIQVVLSPASVATGYELVDVADSEPWKSIR